MRKIYEICLAIVYQLGIISARCGVRRIRQIIAMFRQTPEEQ
jgi:hypothetical protein